MMPTDSLPSDLQLLPLRAEHINWLYALITVNLGDMMPEAWNQDFMIAALAHGNHYLLHHDQQRIGFISWRQRAEILHLAEIHLDPAFHGQGLGTRTLALFEQIARQFGHQCISLNVSPRNGRAQALYLRTGFQIIEQHPDRIYMEKLLAEHSSTR